MLKQVSTALACATLAACVAGPGDYPSLAVRDAERVSGTFEPDAASSWTPAAPPDAVLDDLERLVAEAGAVHDSYRGKLDRVRDEVLAARGAEQGSDRWAVAMIAIAELETERSRAMIALADIDRLYVAAAAEGQSLDELEAAQNLVAGIVDDETAKIDELFAALR